MARHSHKRQCTNAWRLSGLRNSNHIYEETDDLTTSKCSDKVYLGCEPSSKKSEIPPKMSVHTATSIRHGYLTQTIAGRPRPASLLIPRKASRVSISAHPVSPIVATTNIPTNSSDDDIVLHHHPEPHAPLGVRLSFGIVGISALMPWNGKRWSIFGKE